ncbi:MAG: 1,6-anhydro-N-acetylmuramyl-L-alanine amidase AmpD [Candidatus Competibacterales bacterium]|nr:1,6-anhydro-N-acetylmuramyl-L-alanine amidase AmpD [Candidatus Competibacterales bacterium]
MPIDRSPATGPLRLDATGDRLRPARWLPSPNHDRRPPGTVIDLVVIHGISLPPGDFGGPWIDALFTNQLDPAAHPDFRELEGLNVSAHLLIRRDGSLTQYVGFRDRAWHAGRSCFRGRERCNDYAIGIELEGTDTRPYDVRQYPMLAAVIAALRRAYPAITPGRITGHADIAPGRKTDPGPAFDWDRLYALLSSSPA